MILFAGATFIRDIDWPARRGAEMTMFLCSAILAAFWRAPLASALARSHYTSFSIFHILRWRHARASEHAQMPSARYYCRYFSPTMILLPLLRHNASLKHRGETPRAFISYARGKVSPHSRLPSLHFTIYRRRGLVTITCVEYCMDTLMMAAAASRGETRDGLR